MLSSPSRTKEIIGRSDKARMEQMFLKTDWKLIKYSITVERRKKCPTLRCGGRNRLAVNSKVVQPAVIHESGAEGR